MKSRLRALFFLGIAIGLPTATVFALSIKSLLFFVFYWPLFMSGVWIVGALYFWLSQERFNLWDNGQYQPELEGLPLLSILIPCFNEGPNIRETIEAAAAQHYAPIEIIAINDGSKDDTREILDALSEEFPTLRVIHLAQNQGKALALQAGATAARSEYLICIDGDALLDPNAAAGLVKPLIANPRLAAVTGNPRIRTRSTLIGRIQVGEFSSIIGLIKRTQMIYGKLFTLSGVMTAFRKQALEEVGYWSEDMITEDIDISWKLQTSGWSILYEPRALCWILMPETLRGLWKQRLRWAQGGAEVFLKYFPVIWFKRRAGMKLLMTEYIVSTLWAYSLLIGTLFNIASWLLPLPSQYAASAILYPNLAGKILILICLFQFTLSVFLERRYEKSMARSLFWVIWYPLIYWLLNCLTTAVAFTKVALKTRRDRARWISPDRGIGRLK